MIGLIYDRGKYYSPDNGGDCGGKLVQQHACMRASYAWAAGCQTRMQFACIFTHGSHACVRASHASPDRPPFPAGAVVVHACTTKSKIDDGTCKPSTGKVFSQTDSKISRMPGQPATGATTTPFAALLLQLANSIFFSYHSSSSLQPPTSQQCFFLTPLQ